MTTSSAHIAIAIAAILCVSLACMAAYDFAGQQKQRAHYLNDIADGVAADIETQLRAPADRLNPSMWQHLFADSLGARGSSLAFLALLDGSGQVLASEGDRFAPAFGGPSGFVRAQGTALYVFDKPVSIPRAETGDELSRDVMMQPRVLPVRLRVGVYASSAAFIRLRAFTRLSVYLAAIVLVIAAACLRGTLLALVRK